MAPALVQPNARHEPRPEAGVQRTLEAVRCSALLATMGSHAVFQERLSANVKGVSHGTISTSLPTLIHKASLPYLFHTHTSSWPALAAPYRGASPASMIKTFNTIPYRS